MDHFLRLSRLLLDETDERIDITVERSKVVVGQLAPLRADCTLEFVPSSLQDVLIHHLRFVGLKAASLTLRETIQLGANDLGDYRDGSRYLLDSPL